MNNRIWLALCGAAALMFVCFGSLHAENVSSQQTSNVELNLSEASSDSFFMNSIQHARYPWMKYYPLYYNYFGLYPFTSFSYFPFMCGSPCTRFSL